MSRKGVPAHERVLARVDHIDECWIFRGETNKRGYGLVAVRLSAGRRAARKAHRVVYEHYYGPIPDGLTIDHLCFNPACVNPEHLEAVTRSENTRRQWAAGRARPGRARAQDLPKTHCRNGHELTDENVIINASGQRRGRRRCRACLLEWQRLQKAA